jgi:hypothetical protein
MPGTSQVPREWSQFKIPHFAEKDDICLPNINGNAMHRFYFLGNSGGLVIYFGPGNLSGWHYAGFKLAIQASIIVAVNR